jgi:ubiquinone/menaquinone biosynthesis C-methylase UbiE
MLDVGRMTTVSARELEGLSYYDMLARLGLRSFNTQGNRPVDQAAAHAGISSSCTVLMVGCGTGATSVHLAEATGAAVTGIDLAQEPVRKARECAQASPARGRLRFDVGDAAALPYADDAFDAVICEYVAFLLPPVAFTGFRRVLKPGGLLALAEMMKDPGVSGKADARILAAEESYSELVGYRFHLLTTDEHLQALSRAGFEDVQVRQRFVEPGVLETARTLGGWKGITAVMLATLRLMRESPVIRKRFLQAGKVKAALIKNRSTARFVFQALVTGRKPGARGKTILK